MGEEYKKSTAPLVDAIEGLGKEASEKEHKD